MGKIVYPINVDEKIIDHAESALIFEHGDMLLENTGKRFSYSYSDLYQIQNVGDIGELKPIVRMKNHPEHK